MKFGKYIFYVCCPKLNYNIFARCQAPTTSYSTGMGGGTFFFKVGGHN